jgi:hypothetical protein
MLTAKQMRLKYASVANSLGESLEAVIANRSQRVSLRMGIG